MMEATPAPTLRRMAVAFVRADVAEDAAYPMSFLLTELGVLVPVVLYYFVGELVGDSPTVGGDYFTFAVIGMAVSTALQAALSGFGGSLQRAQNRGTFETLLVAPVPWTFLPVAMNLWRTALGLLNGALVLGFGILLGADVRVVGLLHLALLMLLGVVASTAVGVVSASLMVLAKRAQPVLTLYGFAASLLGGALFSVDQLPSWVQPLSWLIPHTYVINASRTVLMDDPGSFAMSMELALLGLTIFNVVVGLTGMYLFARSLQYGRKHGSLSGY